MTTREDYAPGVARGAEVRKNGDRWTLVLVRDLHHPPEKVWRALTDRDEVREWAPFDPDRNLDSVGPVSLSTVATSIPTISESSITRAEAPRLLEYGWSGNDIRWELEPSAGGTRLTLWHNIGRPYIAMGAAGWHICLDVLDRYVGGRPIGRIAGADAMKFEWKRLRAEYARQFGIEDSNQQPKI